MEHHPQAAVSEAELPADAVGFAGFRRILVGFDADDSSRDALALAKALCLDCGAELIIGSIRADWPDLRGGEHHRLAIAQDEARIGAEASRLLDSLPFTVRVTSAGDEPSGLKELAAAEQADLIVLGSTHRGPLGRVLPGSVGERVLDGAPCSVAIAPRGLADRELRLRQIAVAHDGSREAARALDLAIRLAERSAASLLIIGAVDLDLDLTGLQPQSALEAEEARMLRHLKRARQTVPTPIATEIRLLHGPPDRVLVEAAAGADLLLLGSRGHYGQVRRLFLGSVASRVARSAPCPTLITVGAQPPTPRST